MSPTVGESVLPSPSSTGLGWQGSYWRPSPLPAAWSVPAVSVQAGKVAAAELAEGYA
ncbi:MAG TPA: hypothetical protein VFP72_20205 [Kineosporiaceae bacterium]|nr:hypothetical protein [Kineosporiaceae bacterium]